MAHEKRTDGGRECGACKKNPFIPYSVVMERADFERFRKNEEELYTSFPIPIIIKDELEQERQSVDARFAVYGNVHFYVMFNTHLLDRESWKRFWRRSGGRLKV